MKKQQQINQVENLVSKRVHTGKLRRIVAGLSAFVLFMTMNTLKFEADALERIPTCGYPYHEHLAECYDADGEAICGYEEHIHTDACFQTRPTESDIAATRIDDYIPLNATVDLYATSASRDDADDADDTEIAIDPVEETVPETVVNLAEGESRQAEAAEATAVATSGEVNGLSIDSARVVAVADEDAWSDEDEDAYDETETDIDETDADEETDEDADEADDEAVADEDAEKTDAEEETDAEEAVEAPKDEAPQTEPEEDAYTFEIGDKALVALSDILEAVELEPGEISEVWPAANDVEKIAVESDEEGAFAVRSLVSYEKAEIVVIAADGEYVIALTNAVIESADETETEKEDADEQETENEPIIIEETDTEIDAEADEKTDAEKEIAPVEETPAEPIEAQLTVNVDFAQISQSGVDFEQDAVVSALDEGVALDVTELLGAPEETQEKTTLDVTVETAAVEADAEGEDEPAELRETVNTEALEVVETTGGVEYADGAISVTGDGSVALSDGENTVVVNVNNYSELVNEVSGEAAAIVVTPVSDTAALPAGDAVFTELEEDAEVSGKIAELKGDAQETVEDENGRVGVRTMHVQMFDIGLNNDNGVIEPDFKVKVQAEFAEPIEGQDFELYHIVDGEPVPMADAVVVDGDVATGLHFETESFSPYAVVWYTVDFEYTDEETGEKIAWSWPGKGSYKISDIMAEIGVTGEIGDVSLTRTEDVGGAENVLYLSKDKTELISEAAFLDTFELTVVVDDSTYVITVTDGAGDVQYSSNLSDFLKSFTIDGLTKDSDGNWQALAGKEYNVKMRFEEVPGGLQFDDEGPLTYTIPANLGLKNQTTTFDITVSDGETNYEVSGNTCTIENGVLRIEWNKDSGNYSKLTGADTAAFVVNIKAEFTENSSISDGSGSAQIVVTEPDNYMTVEKTAEYNKNNDTIHYTVVMNEYGNGAKKDISINDVLSGSALEYVQDSVHIQKNNTDVNMEDGYNVSFGADGRSMTVTFPDLPTANNQNYSYKVEYDVKVNYDKFEENNVGVTADNTKNDVNLSYKNWDSPEVKTDSSSTDFEGKIEYRNGFGKSGAAEENEVVRADGTRYKLVDWTMTVNDPPKVSVGGSKVTDSIADNSKDIMSYDESTPITIDIYDKNGNFVRQETRNYSAIPYDSTNKTWNFNLPSDTEPYKYVISYKTIVETTNLTDDVKVYNDGSNDKTGGDSSHADVGPDEGNKVDYSKTASSISTTDIEWTITVDVPANGSSKFVVTDTLPQELQNNAVADILDTSKGETAGGVTITGMVAGETVDVQVEDTLVRTVTSVVTGEQVEKHAQKVVMTFSNNGKPGTAATGEKREFVIKIYTKVDPDWFESAKSLDYLLGHVNTAKLNYNNVELEPVKATATPKDMAIRKALVSGYGESTADTKAFSFTNTDGSVVDNCYIYMVTLDGVNSDAVHLEDNFDTDKLEYVQLWNNNSDYSKPRFTYSGVIYGTDEVWQISFPNNTGTFFDPVSTAKGISMDITVPKKAEGGYYSYYYLYYVLRIKDKEAMQAAAAATSDKLIKLDNKVTWSKISATETTATYRYDPVDKTVVENATDENDNYVYFKIELNKNKAKYNLDGSDDLLEVTDKFSKSLLVNFNSIKVETDPANRADQVEYDMSDDTATFWIPDETAVTITYRAKLSGSNDYTNTVTFEGKIKSAGGTGKQVMTAEGSATIYQLQLIKAEENKLNNRLSGAKFALYGPYETSATAPAAGDQPRTNPQNNEQYFETGANGVVRIIGDTKTVGWAIQKDKKYFLKEIETPAGYTTRPGKDPEYFSFIISDTPDYQNYVYMNADELKIYNRPTDDQLRITKNFGSALSIDDLTTEQKKSIKFTIKDGDTVINEVDLTDFNEDGVYVQTENIDPGKTYTVVETIDKSAWPSDEYTDNGTSWSANGGDSVESLEARVDIVKGTRDAVGYGRVTFTNDYTPKKINISASKTWDDAGHTDKRPASIDLTLYRADADGNSVKVEKKTITAADEWPTVTWENLDAVDEQGRKYTYNVVEGAISYYTASYDPATLSGKGTINVTNTYSEDASLTVEKKWLDQNDEEIDNDEGSVTVQLQRQRKEVPQYSTIYSYQSVETGWQWVDEVTNHALLANIGDNVTIVLNGTAGQAKLYLDGDKAKDFDCWTTNNDSYTFKYTGQNIEIKGFGSTTPSSISASATATEDSVPAEYSSVGDDWNETAPTYELKAGNDWTHTFSGLVLSESAYAYRYYVKEISAKDSSGESYDVGDDNFPYEIVYGDSSSSEGGTPVFADEAGEAATATLTNKKDEETPEPVSVTAKKTWDGSEEWPADDVKVEVQLFIKEGETYTAVSPEKKGELNSTNKTVTWDELDALEAGKQYVVKETKVLKGSDDITSKYVDPGYVAAISGTATINNVPKVDVVFKKTWEDGFAPVSHANGGNYQYNVYVLARLERYIGNLNTPDTEFNAAQIAKKAAYLADKTNKTLPSEGTDDMPATLTGDFEITWSDLDPKAPDGTAYIYNVVEEKLYFSYLNNDTVSSAFNAQWLSVPTDNTNITNYYNVTELDVSKVWDNDEKPTEDVTITYALYAQEKLVSTNNEAASGQEYGEKFAVKEPADGTAVPVTIVATTTDSERWTATAAYTVSNGETASAKFKNLPRYRYDSATGKLYLLKYTVEEVSIEGASGDLTGEYGAAVGETSMGTVTISDTNEYNIDQTVTVTNKKVPTVEITATKGFANNDAGNEVAQDIEAVQVTLYRQDDANGTVEIGGHKYVAVTEDALGNAIVNPAVILPATTEETTGSGADETTVIVNDWTDAKNVWPGLAKYVDNDSSKAEIVYLVKETGVAFTSTGEDAEKVYTFVDPSMFTVTGEGDVTLSDNKGTAAIVNTPTTVEVPVEKTWADFASFGFGWTLTFKLQYREKLISGTGVSSADGKWHDADDDGAVKTLTLTKERGQAADSVNGSFGTLPKYRVEPNGNVYELQYSAEEIAYSVSDASGEVCALADGVYTGDSKYESFFDHDANENWDNNFQIRVHNSVKTVTEGDKITVSIEKKWEDENGVAIADTDGYTAKFQLKRYKHTEYRDLTNIPADAANVTVRLVDNSDNLITEQTFKAGSKIKIQATFAANKQGYLVFKNDSYGYNFRLQNNNNTGNKVLTSSDSFTLNSSLDDGTVIVLKMTEGDLGNIADGKFGISLTDRMAGTDPAPDDSYEGPIFTLPTDGDNGSWKKTLTDLVREETSLSENQENIAIYGYYFEEIETKPVGYKANYVDENNQVINKDNRIYTDSEITATNSPADDLKIEKRWYRLISDQMPPVVINVSQTVNNVTSDVTQTAYDNNGNAVSYSAEFGGYILDANNGWAIHLYGLPTGVSRKYAELGYIDGGNASNGYTGGTLMTIPTGSKGFDDKHYWFAADGAELNESTYSGVVDKITTNGGDNVSATEGTMFVYNVPKYIGYQLEVHKKWYAFNGHTGMSDITSTYDENTHFIMQIQQRAIWDGTTEVASDWQNYGDTFEVYRARTSATDDADLEHVEQGEWLTTMHEKNFSAYGYLWNEANQKYQIVTYEYRFVEVNVVSGTDGRIWSKSTASVNDPDAGHDHRYRLENFEVGKINLRKKWTVKTDDKKADEVYFKIWSDWWFSAYNATPKANGKYDVAEIIGEDIAANPTVASYWLTNGTVKDLGGDIGWVFVVTGDKADDLWTDLTVKGLPLLKADPNSAKDPGNNEYGEVMYTAEEVAVLYKGEDDEEARVYGINDAKFPYYEPIYHRVTRFNGEGGTPGSWDEVEQHVSNGESFQIDNATVEWISYFKATNSDEPTWKFHTDKSWDNYPEQGTQIVLELQALRLTDDILGTLTKTPEQEADPDGITVANMTQTQINQLVQSNTGWVTASVQNPAVTLPRSWDYASMPEETAEEIEAKNVAKAEAWSVDWSGAPAVWKNNSIEFPEEYELLYRVVETSSPAWTRWTVTPLEINPLRNTMDQDVSNTAVDDTSGELTITKTWNTDGEWPEGYVVNYKVVQHAYLAKVETSTETKQTLPAESEEATLQTTTVRTLSYKADTTKAVFEVDNFNDYTVDSPAVKGQITKETNGVTLKDLPKGEMWTAPTDEEEITEEMTAVGIEAGKTYGIAYAYEIVETNVTAGSEILPFTATSGTLDVNTVSTGTLNNVTTELNVKKAWTKNGSAENVTWPTDAKVYFDVYKVLTYNGKEVERSASLYSSYTAQAPIDSLDGTVTVSNLVPLTAPASWTAKSEPTAAEQALYSAAGVDAGETYTANLAYKYVIVEDAEYSVAPTGSNYLYSAVEVDNKTEDSYVLTNDYTDVKLTKVWIENSDTENPIPFPAGYKVAWKLMRTDSKGTKTEIANSGAFTKATNEGVTTITLNDATGNVDNRLTSEKTSIDFGYLPTKGIVDGEVVTYIYTFVEDPDYSEKPATSSFEFSAQEATVADGTGSDEGKKVHTLTNDLTSVDVTKTWAGAPYADSVTVKLYRTTEAAPVKDPVNVTIKVTFSDNADKVNGFTATVNGEVITLTKDDNTGAWVGGPVQLSKGKEYPITFSEVDTEAYYSASVADGTITVPDSDTYTAEFEGTVTASASGRKITLTVNWTGDNSWNSDLWSGVYQYNSDNYAVDTEGNRPGFAESFTSTNNSQTIDHLTTDGYRIVLGEIVDQNGDPDLNSYDVSVDVGSLSNKWDKQVVIDIPGSADDQNVTLTIAPKSNVKPTGTGSITIQNETSTGYWYNPLKQNGYDYCTNGTLNGNSSLTISDLPSGEFTIQMGVANPSQITNANSVDDWSGNCNIHINLNNGESKTVKIVAAQQGGDDGESVSIASDKPTVEVEGVEITTYYGQPSNPVVGTKYDVFIQIQGGDVDNLTVEASNADIGTINVERWNDTQGRFRVYFTPTGGTVSFSVVSKTAAQSKASARSVRSLAPVLKAQAATATNTTVALEHGSGTVEPEIDTGDEAFPDVRNMEELDTQTLTADSGKPDHAGGWYYKWSDLPTKDANGATYHYYVIEEVPTNTKKVEYTRDDTDGTTVTIENTPVENPEYGSFKVTKKVEGAETDRNFTIRLKRVKDSTTEWLHYTDASNYSWGEETGATTWTFNNGGNVNFTGLDLGYTYTAVEDTSTGMVEVTGYNFSNASTTTAEAEVTEAKEYTGTITNKYTPETTDFEFSKQWYDSIDTMHDGWVTGATIDVKLERYLIYGDNIQSTEKDSYALTLTGLASNTNTTVTDDDGSTLTVKAEAVTVTVNSEEKTVYKFTIDGLWKQGKMTIDEEEKTGTWKYVVSETSATVNGETYTASYFDENGTARQSDATDEGVIRNTKSSGYELPSTGGAGTGIFYGAGLSLMLFAFLGFVLTARKRRRGEGI